MKKLLLIIALMACVAPVYASPASDNFRSCLRDATTGKDRTELSRWLFAMMASSPKLSAMSAISAEQRDQLNARAGVIINRIFLVDCKDPYVSMIKTDGSTSTKVAFGMIGEVSVGELMAAPEVETKMIDFVRYLDQAGFAKLMAQ
ncbi:MULTISPECIES: hypothetical protein [unclassified Paludibacterium]|uniref:hypothetical protein n=1 Tax=unclassified Paludibacterium TaxID=2618429 RepID=UPI001C051244|nr:hypothetical protein [Paludibacterium sp. B53371]BEV72588.1 hypothetical protein THUN1379_20700 [Paludibacterium sp. THUN1379]